jgi:adhesin transport system outer membrane protein
MYKKPALLSAVAVGVVSVLGISTQAKAETLQETLQQAMISHPSIKGALASKDVAEQGREEVKSDLYPFINAGTSVGYVYANNSTSRGLTVSRGSGSSGIWEGNASLTQPLYNGWQTQNRIGAADARIQAADLTVTDAKQNLALQATQAHIALLQAQETLGKTQSYINTIDDYLDRIQFMVDEGVADETEVTQAQNISLQLKSSLQDSEGQMQAALVNYNEVVGRVPRTTLVKPDYVTNLPMDIEVAISQAQSIDPIILANKKEMEALGFEVKAEKGALHPDVNAELSGIRREQREIIGGELLDARALLTVNWDFETGGASKARQRQSMAQYSELEAQNEEQMRVIEGDVRRAYAELRTAQSQVDLVRQRENVTQELFGAYKTQFEGAVVRLLQIMQAENQVYNAQLESIAAEYRYLFAQYAVLASIGELNKVAEGSDLEKIQPVSYVPVARDFVTDVQETIQETIQEPVQKPLSQSPRPPAPEFIAELMPENPVPEFVPEPVQVFVQVSDTKTESEYIHSHNENIVFNDIDEDDFFVQPPMSVGVPWRVASENFDSLVVIDGFESASTPTLTPIQGHEVQRRISKPDNSVSYSTY